MFWAIRFFERPFLFCVASTPAKWSKLLKDGYILRKNNFNIIDNELFTYEIKMEYVIPMRLRMKQNNYFWCAKSTERRSK